MGPFSQRRRVVPGGGAATVIGVATSKDPLKALALVHNVGESRLEALPDSVAKKHVGAVQGVVRTQAVAEVISERAGEVVRVHGREDDDFGASGLRRGAGLCAQYGILSVGVVAVKERWRDGPAWIRAQLVPLDVQRQAHEVPLAAR